MRHDPAQPTLLRRKIRLPLPSRSSFVVLAALAALVLFFLRQSVLGGRVFYERDLHLQWYGQVESFVRSIVAGSWPLWDPYASFGQPLLANANNQILYPPTWLHLVVRPWTYYTLFLGAHLLFSGYGVVRLVERFGVSRLGAFLAAALWVGSGPFLSLGNAWNHLAAAAWIPWILLGAEVTWATGGIRSVVVWAIAWTLQIVAGSPDIVVMTAVLVAACAVRHWNWRRWTGPSNRRVLSSTMAAAAMALALSAAQWVPSLELASRSERWNLAGAERTYWSIHPAGLLQTVVPIPWYEIPLAQRWRATLFEGREPFLFSIYLGIPMLVLAALAVIGSRDAQRWVFLGTGVAAALVALGRHAPFYALAVGALPPLRVLRFPAKGLILTAFCLAILAGAGFDSWRKPWTRRRLVAVGALLGLVLLAAALLICLVRFDAETWGPLFLIPPPPGASYGGLLRPVAWSLAGVAVLLSLLLGLLVARAAGGRAATASAVLVAVVAVADLAWHHRQINRTASRDLFTLKPEAVSAIDQRDLRRLYVYDYSMAEGRSQRYLGRETPYVTPGFRRDTPFEWAEAFALRMYLLPPIGAAWGLYGSYERDNLGIQPTPLADLNSLLVFGPPPVQIRLLRLAAVSQVLALHTAGLEDLEPVRTLPGPFFEPIHLFRVPTPLPRTYVVGDARVADGNPALDALIDPGCDITREVVLASGSPRRASPGFRGSSRIVQMKPDRVHIESESNEPGYVVLVDAFDPGWRAWVDGREAPVLRANVAFRAIPVAEGRHEIDLVYRPRSVLVGAAVSAVTLAAIGLFFMRSALRRPLDA